MGWIDDDIKAWRESAEYARSQELMRELGHRTDLDRVVIACHNDIVLAEQDEVAGYREGTFFVEVVGIRGVSVAEVFQQYCRICHMLVPDNAVSMSWKEIQGADGPVVLEQPY
ncbi:hypothetical protein G6L37_06870 [Agrobacterium rubi]|nr:hypothetical protein [Agrobacterium rubi]NTF25087.1 hypothetical protein [Agrobacterium rubi]